MIRKHLFIIDRLEKLRFELDTSLHLAYELQQLGQQTFACTAADLSWVLGQTPRASVRELCFGSGPTTPELGGLSSCNLDEFSTIQVRTEPPYDMAYVASTWILDGVGDKTWVINSPAALRTFNEKLSIFSFPETSAPGLVSSTQAQIEDFITESCGGDGILKPLDWYGGKGVERIQMDRSEASSRIHAALAEYRQLLVQPFDEAIFQGEIRVFAAGGHPMAWCLKIPQKGSYLANTAAGVKLESFTPSQKLYQKVAGLAKKLWSHGIYFVGFDIIGDNISEINITSPRLLTVGNEKKNSYRQLAEKMISDREQSLNIEKSY